MHTFFRDAELSFLSTDCSLGVKWVANEVNEYFKVFVKLRRKNRTGDLINAKESLLEMISISL